MKLTKKVLLICLLFGTFLLLFNMRSYAAGTQKWESLDYNVSVKSDGSMDVIETWNIKVSNTNTLFKNFEVDSSKYSDITNVKVTLIEDGVETPLEQIYEEQYYVDSGCYYALYTSYSTFEIAWNVGLDNSSDTRIYKIYYTVNDAVKVYNDCTELYWMFLNTDNAISGKNITGTITLPQKVSDIEKLRVWAHGNLNGEIQKTAADEITFSLPTVDSGEMLEVRIVTEENIYEDTLIYKNTNELSSIIAEEQEWADEANEERKTARKSVITVVIINIIVILIFASKFKKYIKIGKELKEKYSYPKSELEYFREIPNEENATPARAVFLHNFENTKSNMESSSISKIFSATILDLSLKGIVKLEPIDDKNIKIILNKKYIELIGDEKIIYTILSNAINSEGYITTKEFSNYAKKNYNDVYLKLAGIRSTVERYEISCGNIEVERVKIAEKWQNKTSVYIVILFCLLCLFPLLISLWSLYLVSIIGAILSYKNYKKICSLSQNGYREKTEWDAFKKYMEDYSLLKEKTVPDIVLWEKFLVYATAFGISKKVIEQLKVVHPEMFMSENDYSGRYTYWNMVSDPRFGNDCFDNFSRSLEKAYTTARSAYSAAHSSNSSGSGGGGGFSGGGGGRRRWRKLRWSLI